MKAYLKFSTYNSFKWRQDPIVNGVEVQLCQSHYRDVNFTVLARTRRCNANGIFQFPNVPVSGKANIFFRVGFLKRNFDLRDGRLYHPSDSHAIPIPFRRYPYPVIVWSSQTKRGIHGEAGFFHGITDQSLGSPSAPLEYSILFRQLRLFAHRGAPYYYPENTTESFLKGLSLGANALEMDICLTKDQRLMVYHDPSPYYTALRNKVEGLPYPRISPRIEQRGQSYYYQYLRWPEKGEYSSWRKMNAPDDLNLINLTAGDIKRIYFYTDPHRKYAGPPLLEELLNVLVSRTRKNLEIFLDLKIDGSRWQQDPGYPDQYARALFSVLTQTVFPGWKFILGSPEESFIRKVAGYFRKQKTPCDHCAFVIDSQGSWDTIVPIMPQPSPLQRNLNARFSVVSVGKFARSSAEKEIAEAVEYREKNSEGLIDEVIFWTLDKPGEIYEAIQNGVDGILTNRPEVAVSIMRRLNLISG